MKKIILAFAAFAAVFSLASCSKEQIANDQPSHRSNPTVKITVNNMDGTVDDGITTKAAKTNWVEGDKINIWFDNSAAHKYGDSFPSRDVHFNPELILTYTGGSWVSTYSEFFDSSKLKASGRIRAIYESTNDFNKTFYFKFQNPLSTDIYDRYHPSAATGNRYMTPMIVAANANYQYDSEENTISANLNAWEFLTKVQILISGLSQTRSYYYLDAIQDAEADGAFYRILGFSLCTNGAIYPYDYETYSFGTAGGTLTDEGMAFYFYDTVTPGVAKTYKFRLSMLQPPSTWISGTATFENKALNTSSNKITCIKIDKSKFSNSSLLK